MIGWCHDHVAGVASLAVAGVDSYLLLALRIRAEEEAVAFFAINQFLQIRKPLREEVIAAVLALALAGHWVKEYEWVPG